jgi:hypothetical protein
MLVDCNALRTRKVPVDPDTALLATSSNNGSITSGEPELNIILPAGKISPGLNVFTKGVNSRYDMLYSLNFLS